MADAADFILNLIDRVTGPARRMTSGVTSLEKALKRLELGATAGEFSMLEKNTRGVAGTLKDLGSSGISAIGGLTQKALVLGGTVAVGLAAAVGSTAIQFADFTQRAEAGFQAVAHGGESATQLFEDIRGVSEDLGLDVQDTTKAFTKLLALQFDPSTAKDIIKMGADLRVVGNTAEDVQGIMLTLGQVKSKGKLQGEELMQLQERGVSGELINQAIAQNMGISVSEVGKAISAGKVDAETAITSIGDAIKKKVGEQAFGEAGRKFATTTLSGMAGIFKSRAQNLLIDLGKEVAPALQETLGTIFDAFDSAMGGGGSEALINGLADGIKFVAGVVRDSIPYVQAFIGGFIDGFKEAWPAISEAVMGLGEFFGLLSGDGIGSVREFAQLLGQTVVFLLGVAAVLGGALVGAVQLGVLAIDGLIAVWNGLITAIGAVVFAVDDTLANLSARWERLKIDALAAGGALVQGLVDGINAGVGMVWEAAQNLGGSVMAGIKAKLGIASPSKEFEWMGEMSALGFTEGLANNLPANDIAIGGASMPAGPVASSFAAPPPALSGGAASGAGGAPSVTINVYMQGGASGEAKQQGDDIAARVRREVEGYFEQFARESAG